MWNHRCAPWVTWLICTPFPLYTLLHSMLLSHLSLKSLSWFLFESLASPNLFRLSSTRVRLRTSSTLPWQQCPSLYPQRWPNPSHCASSTASLLHQDSSLSLSRPLYTFRMNRPRLLNFLSQSFIPWPRSSLDCRGLEAPTPS